VPILNYSSIASIKLLKHFPIDRKTKNEKMPHYIQIYIAILKPWGRPYQISTMKVIFVCKAHVVEDDDDLMADTYYYEAFRIEKDLDVVSKYFDVPSTFSEIEQRDFYEIDVSSFNITKTTLEKFDGRPEKTVLQDIYKSYEYEYDKIKLIQSIFMLADYLGGSTIFWNAFDRASYNFICSDEYELTYESMTLEKICKVKRDNEGKRGTKRKIKYPTLKCFKTLWDLWKTLKNSGSSEDTPLLVKLVKKSVITKSYTSLHDQLRLHDYCNWDSCSMQELDNFISTISKLTETKKYDYDFWL
jgi:hypothetical protein